MASKRGETEPSKGIKLPEWWANRRRTARWAKEPTIRAYYPAFYHKLHQKGLLKPGSVVVDIGCGGAQYFPKLYELMGKEGLILGIDKYEKVLNIARMRCRGIFRNAKFHKIKKGNKIPLPDNFADATSAIEMMQYAWASGKNQRDADMVLFEEIKRITKPGGVMCVGFAAFPTYKRCKAFFKAKEEKYSLNTEFRTISEDNKTVAGFIGRTKLLKLDFLKKRLKEMGLNARIYRLGRNMDATRELFTGWGLREIDIPYKEFKNTFSRYYIIASEDKGLNIDGLFDLNYKEEG